MNLLRPPRKSEEGDGVAEPEEAAAGLLRLREPLRARRLQLQPLQAALHQAVHGRRRRRGRRQGLLGPEAVGAAAGLGGHGGGAAAAAPSAAPAAAGAAAAGAASASAASAPVSRVIGVGRSTAGHRDGVPELWLD